MARALAPWTARGKNLCPGAVLDALGGGWPPRGLARAAARRAGGASGWQRPRRVCVVEGCGRPARMPPAKLRRRAARAPPAPAAKTQARPSRAAVRGRGERAARRGPGGPAGEEPQGDESPAPRGHGTPPARGRTRPAVRRAVLRVRDGHPSRAETRLRGSVHGQRGPRRRRGDARLRRRKTSAMGENTRNPPRLREQRAPTPSFSVVCLTWRKYGRKSAIRTYDLW